MSAPEALALIAAGVAIGAYATAIGAGGGFLIAPLLLLRYPEAEPAFVTTGSLTVVTLTSAISSLVVHRERIVDRPIVFAMASVAIPAALFGAVGTSLLPRNVFAAGFAVFLLLLAAYLVWRPTAGVVRSRGRSWRRVIVTRDGARYEYRVPIVQSILPNVGEAFLAALAGIGGGPIGVPLMTRIMRIPHAVAVPSIHLLIFMQSLSVVALHLALDHGGDPMRDVPFLGLGVVVANPLGHWLRRRLGEGFLMRALAIGLVAVAATTATAAH
ncbi:MAG: sulfite exporter TauE/SafE family protein [Chloroflexi bacterium]|nr:sulfite exporter TauE/SafE family protein [Chloroflexota bacterium]